MAQQHPLLWFFILSFLPFFSQAQEGFKSLNCGGGKYNDNSTQLIWEADSNYINYGNVAEIEASLQQNTSVPLRTLRYFPIIHGRSKYCYLFDSSIISKGITYIVRASFLYGNYDGLNQPSSFGLLLNYDVWVENVTTSSVMPIVHEITYISSMDTLSVCLTPHKYGNSTPFISTLELRALASTMYVDDTSGALLSGYALLLLHRINYGANTNDLIRYPYDMYDRIWQANMSIPSVSTNPNNINNNAGTYPEEPPKEVLATAITTVTNNLTITIDEYIGGVQDPGYYILMHFAEVEVDIHRNFTIILDSITPTDVFISPYPLGTPLYSRIDQKIGLSSPLHITLMSSNSSLPPILNAMEMLQWSNQILRTSGTSQGDLDAINQLQQELGLTNFTNGDPCLPLGYGWVWVICNNDTQPRIIEIHLANFNLSGAIPLSIQALSKLQIIDLSHNKLNGSIPNLSSLTNLQILDLQDNNLNGALPQSLGSLSHLQQLHLDQNDLCGSIPSSLLGTSLNFTYTKNKNLCTDSKLCSCLETSSTFTRATNEKKYIIATSFLGALYLLSLIVVLVYARRLRRHNQSPEHDEVSIEEGTQTIKDATYMTRAFKYDEIQDATNNFSEEIGEGGFGKVFYGVLKSGEEVAVKMLTTSSNQGLKEFTTEVSILSKLHHKNLVSLIGYCIENTYILVYEYIPTGNLRDLLYGYDESKRKYLPWMTRLQIALDASLGLEYLHSGCEPTIIHRDVKSSNILLGNKLQAKVSDFGLSRLMMKEGDKGLPISHVSTAHVCGTPGYLDPDYNLTSQLTEKSDVYSFGVVLLELVCGRPPIDFTSSYSHIAETVKAKINSFKTQNDVIDQGKLIKEILDPSLNFEDYEIESVWKVVVAACKCVDKDRNKRPNMSQVVHELRDALSIELKFECNNLSPSDTNNIADNPYQGNCTTLSTIYKDVIAQIQQVQQPEEIEHVHNEHLMEHSSSSDYRLLYTDPYKGNCTTLSTLCKDASVQIPQDQQPDEMEHVHSEHLSKHSNSRDDRSLYIEQKLPSINYSKDLTVPPKPR